MAKLFAYLGEEKLRTVLSWNGCFYHIFWRFFKVIAITFWSELWRFSEKKQSYADFVKISVTYLKLEIAKIDLR
jgi:hypothetical protein